MQLPVTPLAHLLLDLEVLERIGSILMEKPAPRASKPRREMPFRAEGDSLVQATDPRPSLFY